MLTGSDEVAPVINAAPIVMGLLGGLALFLFGLEQMASALKHVAGDRLKNILARLTTNRFRAAGTGALVTAVIQSSSVTTVLVVGFISAGVLTLTQSVGIIIGAKVGTTITAQIIAFKITQYALLMIALGFAVLFFVRSERVKQYGAILMGLGLVFFGMALMGEATSPLRDFPPFIELMTQLQNPLLGITVGALFTAVIQSSSATTGIVIVLAAQGYITLEAGIAMALGANIGTCVTAMLAAIGKPREAVRAAVVHVLISVLGVLIWVFFIGELATLARTISPAAAGLDGVERMAAETPRQIANAFTFFNVANAFIFIWFTTPIARLARRLVPDREIAVPDRMRPKYLDTTVLETPGVALDAARKEIVRLSDIVEDMIARLPQAAFRGSPLDVSQLARLDDDVDTLHAAIVDYLGRIGARDLTDAQTHELLALMTLANALETIGDKIETRFTTTARRRLEHNLIISDETMAKIMGAYTTVAKAFSAARHAIEQRDADAAANVRTLQNVMNDRVERARRHMAKRLSAPEPNRIAAYTVESEFIENLKQVFYLCLRLAENACAPEREPDEKQEVDGSQ